MPAGRAVAAALLAALAAAALPAPPAAAEEDLRGTVEDQRRRIEELERRVLGLEGAAEPARPEGGPGDAPGDGPGEDGSYLVGTVRRPAGADFRIGGYATILLRLPDDPDRTSSFDGIRVVPQLAFQVSPGIEFAAEIEFERGGADASFLDDNEVLVEYAEARFHVSEALVPKAGILLIPFLRYNLQHDDPIWNLQDRPFTANGRVFKTALQQPGFGAEGVLPLADGSSLNYNLALTSGLDDGVTNASFSGARTPFGPEDNNDDKALWARAGAAPRLPFVDAADFGVSWARSGMEDAGAPTVAMTGWGVDGKVTRDRFDLIFEWTAFHYDRPASQPAATFPRQTSGAFVQVDTRLLRGFPETAGGILGKSSELILAARWEACDLNERVTGASREDDSRALTLGLALRCTPKTVLRLERKWERTSYDGPDGRDLGQWVLSLSTYF